MTCLHRFAKYYKMENGTDYRTLVKAYAIRFDVLVNGNVSIYISTCYREDCDTSLFKRISSINHKHIFVVSTTWELNLLFSLIGRKIQHDPHTYQHGGSLYIGGGGEFYWYTWHKCKWEYTILFLCITSAFLPRLDKKMALLLSLYRAQCCVTLYCWTSWRERNNTRPRNLKRWNIHFLTNKNPEPFPLKGKIWGIHHRQKGPHRWHFWFFFLLPPLMSKILDVTNKFHWASTVNLSFYLVLY